MGMDNRILRQNPRFTRPTNALMQKIPVSGTKKKGLSEKTTNKTDRLFALVLLLQNRPNMTTKELAEHFGVTRRTIFRDLRVLSEAGIPLTYIEEGGGYEILEGYQLPPLMLTGREAAVLLVGTSFAKLQTDPAMRKDADQVAMKIRTILPSNIREQIDRLLHATVLDPYWLNNDPHPQADEAGGLWYQVGEAISGRHPVFIHYMVGSRNEVTRRKVDPLGIVFYFDHWTMVGYCHLRKDFRSFRLDQIRECHTMSDHYRGYDDFNLQRFLEEKGMGRQQRIALHFSPRVYPDARRRLPARIEEEIPGENGTTVIFYFENLDYIANWMLRFGTHVRIVEPEALRGKVLHLLTEMQALAHS